MKKIFYYCFAGSHSSVIAANIHLNILPLSRIPSIREIQKIPEFDNKKCRERGVPIFLGRDESENEIYVIGLGKDRKLGLQIIYHLLEERDHPGDWKFYDSLAEIDLLTKVGGFLSGNLGWVRFGRPLAALGIQKSYPRICSLVQKVKEWNTYCQEK